MKVLLALAILTISSGCSLLKRDLVEPLCLPDRPILQPITVEEQININPATLLKIADNDLALKSWLVTTERITEAHNEQFKAKCEAP